MNIKQQLQYNTLLLVMQGAAVVLNGVAAFSKAQERHAAKMASRKAAQAAAWQTKATNAAELYRLSSAEARHAEEQHRLRVDALRAATS